MLNAGTVQAFATLGIEGFKASMRKIRDLGNKLPKDLDKSFMKAGQSLTTRLTIPIGIAGGAMIKLASDAEETSAKFNTVFSSINADAKRSAKVLTDSFGLSQKASQELLGNTGDLLTGFGFTQSAALDLSTEVNKLAVDLASFTNFSGGAEGASAALTKALLGERESVKSLGISILEADVNAKMLVNTQKGLTFESERQAKAFATLQLAQEQSKNAIGDFARTSDSFANQTRQLRAEISDLAVVFGNKLLPLATRLVGSARGMIDSFSGLTDASKSFTLALGGIAFIAGPTLLFLGSLAKAYLGLVAVLPKVIAGVKALNLAMLANPYVAVGVAVAALAIKFNNARIEANKLKKEIQDASNLEFKVSSLQAVNDTIDKVQQKIDDLRAKGSSRNNNIISGSLPSELKELKSLEQQLATLIQQRSNIVFGGFANELKAESEEATRLAQSIKNVSKSIEAVRVSSQAPVDFIFDVQEIVDVETGLDRLHNQMVQFQSGFTLPEMIAPEGSIAKLQQDLAKLQLQLAYTADPTKFAMLKEQIEQTQLALDGMTSNATQSGNAMMGLANSIGNIFERAALQGENLSQVLKGIIKQLAARAFVTGIGALLTGGASLGDKGFLGTLFGGLFHSGGVVQGSGERMIRAKGGEMVLTKSQQKALSMGATTPTSSISPDAMSMAFERALDRKLNKLSSEEIYYLSRKGQFTF